MTDASEHTFVFASYPHIDKKIVEDLVNRAQQTYENLPSDEHCWLARMLFLRLIDLSMLEQNKISLQPGRIFMEDLVLSNVRQSNSMRTAVNAFVDANILIIGEMSEKPFVTVRDEILLQEWELLHSWILEEGPDTLCLLRRLRTAASDWQLEKRMKESLYRGKFLAEGLTLAQKNLLNQLEDDFLKASLKEQGTQFNWEVAKMASLGVSVVGAGFIMLSKMRSEAQLRTAQYWRHQNQREVNKLRKQLRKQK
jgi:hypothetical protein